MLLTFFSVSINRSERHSFLTMSSRDTICSRRSSRKMSNSMGFFSILMRRPERRSS